MEGVAEEETGNEKAGVVGPVNNSGVMMEGVDVVPEVAGAAGVIPNPGAVVVGLVAEKTFTEDRVVVEFDPTGRVVNVAFDPTGGMVDMLFDPADGAFEIEVAGAVGPIVNEVG